MKKVLLIVFLVVLILAFASCGSGSAAEDSKNVAIIGLIVTFGLALCVIPAVTITGKMRRKLKINSFHMSMNNYLNDYDPTHEETFDEKLKKAKLNPQKDIIYGQNRFAIDSLKKMIFVQSSKATDGVLLGFGDIVSYELIKDGTVIARPGEGLKDSGPAAGEDGIICSDLRLVIKTKKPSDPEVVLPFIAFSIDSEFAYKEALDAAKEAAEALNGIIL